MVVYEVDHAVGEAVRVADSLAYRIRRNPVPHALAAGAVLLIIVAARRRKR